MGFIARIIILPLLIVLMVGVVIIPFTPILLFMQPSLETFFVVLLLVGLWPVVLAYVHGALFVEHFITRSISKEFLNQYDMVPDILYTKLSLKAANFLSSALDIYGTSLDSETNRRGQALVNRHKAIVRFIWPGYTVSAIGAIGLVLIDVLDIAPGHL